MKHCWKCTHPQAIRDVDEFVSSSEQICMSLALHHLLTNESSAVNYLSLISESETHILYIFITHRVKYFYKCFISWYFDDCGLQIMKTPNSVSQKIWIFHKINKKGYFKQKCQASEKYFNFYLLDMWLGLLLHELLHQCGVAWRRSDCGTAQM